MHQESVSLEIPDYDFPEMEAESQAVATSTTAAAAPPNRRFRYSRPFTTAVTDATTAAAPRIVASTALAR